MASRPWLTLPTPPHSQSHVLTMCCTCTCVYVLPGDDWPTGCWVWNTREKFYNARGVSHDAWTNHNGWDQSPYGTRAVCSDSPVHVVLAGRCDDGKETRTSAECAAAIGSAPNAAGPEWASGCMYHTMDNTGNFFYSPIGADENDEASGAQANEKKKKNGVRYCQVDYSSPTAAPTKRPTPPITQPQTRPQPHRESNHEPDHEPANPTPHGQLHRQPHVRSNLHELAELGAIDLGSRTPAWSRVQRINQRFDRSRVRRSSRGGSCSAGRKVRSGRLRVRLRGLADVQFFDSHGASDPDEALS